MTARCQASDQSIRKSASIELVYAYSAYGETAVLGPDGGNSLRYTGREDDGNGLFYYRARYYDPVLKRFVSEDPIELEAGPNFYAYVDGNPVNFVDPEGLQPGGSGTSGFNKQLCVQNYLNQNYGSFVANSLVPNFSVLSYVPGSGTASQAWTSAGASVAGKGALVVGPYGAGQAMNLAAAASATAAQMTMQSLAPAATPGNRLINASKWASRGFGLLTAATLPFSTVANLMALQACSCTP